MKAPIERIIRCPAEATLQAIGGRWKVLILWHLFPAPRRFSELRRSLPDCTQKMLTQQLREMEAHGLIHRRVYPQVPPKVEYSLTPWGQTLRPVIEVMCKWGQSKRGGMQQRFACAPRRKSSP